MPYSLSALSQEFRTMKDGTLSRYVERYSHLEAGAYEFVKSKPHKAVFDDQAVWPDIKHPTDRDDYRYLHDELGVFRRLISRLGDNKRWFDCITYQFDKRFEQIPQASVQMASQLVPHLAKAVELGRIYHRLRAIYGAVLGALDNVGVGMCVILADGEILIANDVAEQIFDAGDGLSKSQFNRIICSSASQSSEIALATSHVSATANGANYRSIHTMYVQRPSGKSPIVVEIAPLRDTYSEIANNLSGAIVTLIDTAGNHDLRLDIFARVYDLTNAESDICRLIFEGYSYEEIAEERRVKISTIKTQMKAIREKTGVSSHVALLRLALQTSPPIIQSKASRDQSPLHQ